MSKILIVEDELPMALALKDNFELEGYEVVVANDGEAGLKNALEGIFDLIILDVMLPKISGFEVCKTARSKGIETPIIMLTARGEEYDKVRGLEFGADDYVTKPFSLIELLARIKAVLRRGAAHKKETIANSEIVIGRLKIDFTSYSALIDDIPVKMSHTEFEILKHLWQKKNETVKREDIMKQVYGVDGEITSRTIDNFIVRLRQKIEIDATNPKYIITVHGLGYKLVLS
ncbi:MAG: response regulator transcription factor [Bacteroidota bacterium]|nr:response regulator transcription factor [Bacteroidota bacterium]